MKKFSLVVVLLLALLLVGCGNKSVDNDSDVVVKWESDFEMSECIRSCEIMWNEETAKLFKDCKTLCEAWEAMETNDARGCESSEGIMRDSCYSDIAYETQNPKLCEKVTDWMIRYGCYASVAEATKDISICDEIEDKMFKAACVESVNSNEE